MKQRKQYVGKPIVHDMLTQYEKRILAMERAGVVPTHKVIYKNAAPFKRDPDQIPHEATPKPTPIPVAIFRFMAILVDYNNTLDSDSPQEVAEGSVS